METLIFECSTVDSLHLMNIVSYYLALPQSHHHKITELLEFNIHCNFEDDEIPERERERERDKKCKVF